MFNKCGRSKEKTNLIYLVSISRFMTNVNFIYKHPKVKRKYNPQGREVLCVEK